MQQDETLAGSNNLEGDCMKKITNFDSNNDIPSEMTTHCACFTTPIDARNIPVFQVFTGNRRSPMASPKKKRCSAVKRM